MGVSGRNSKNNGLRTGALFFSFPRLALRARVALRAKYRVRPAWLIKRLSCRLKIGQKMRNTYACNNLTIAERIEEAWMPVLFLRLWKQWLKIEKHDVYSNFISDQTCRDMIISGHSLILTVKVFAKYYPEALFAPLVFGSEQCEKLFAKIRCFKKMKTNVALFEMIDISGRLRKLSENVLCVNKTRQR